MATIKKITDKQGNDIYLRTHTKAVVDSDGNTVEDLLDNKQGKLTFDTTPTASSGNPVTSDGIKSVLETKADKNSVSALGNRVSTIEEELTNLVGLNQSNFMGIFDEAQNLPSMSNSGWALVGSDMTAMAVYVWYDSTTEWVRFGSQIYNMTDYSSVVTQVATIGSKMGDLTQLQTTDKTSVVNAVNEIVAAMADQSALETLTRKVNANTEKLESFVVTDEDGFYLVDDSFYIGAYINAEGSSGFGGGLTYKIV